MKAKIWSVGSSTGQTIYFLEQQFARKIKTLLGSCYGLNVCVPPKFVYWNLIPNVVVFGGVALWRGLGHEGGALMNGISVLIKETTQSSLTSSVMWGHRERMAICEPGRRLSSDTKSAGTLTLGFPASRTVRNECLNCPVYAIVLEQPEWANIGTINKRNLEDITT